MTDPTLFPDATELELDRLRAKVRALEECLRLANESTLQTAEHVTKMVREEREACAALVIERARLWTQDGDALSAAEDIATAIRARGSK